MPIYKLTNTIQNYAWGSKTSLNELFGLENSKNLPQAEIWMGAHPNASSKLTYLDMPLGGYISNNGVKALGEYTVNRFGELPFLFKVLAAETPLSIQVHPNKEKAQLGFDRENAQGIAIDAAHRNYKDPNHKPELVYALTSYKAMNGFRPIGDIVTLFKEVGISALSTEIEALSVNRHDDGLKTFFSAIMSLQGEQKQLALSQLYAAYTRSAITRLASEALEYSKRFYQYYADDIGLFSPLMLNTLELSPGEAMFLDAETPHAYVEGTALEIMANSDNVLRAGLTPKHIDVNELIDNTQFKETKPNTLRLLPVRKGNKLLFPVPVDDFSFEIVNSSNIDELHYLRSAEILFCISGSATIVSGENEVTINKGESVFIPCSTGHYKYNGDAKFARAFN